MRHEKNAAPFVISKVWKIKDLSGTSQMLGLSLIFATPLCWSGPSGHCGSSWTASTRCGCRCTGHGGSTSATMEAWRGWTRPRRLPNMERLKSRSGGARLTFPLLLWAQNMTTIVSSARWDMISSVQTHRQGAVLTCKGKEGLCTYWPTSNKKEAWVESAEWQ